MTRCLWCTAAWGGANTAHCGGEGGCHETFSGITAFDRHRNQRGAGSCHTPAEVGMVDAGRAYPAWTIPGTAEHETAA